MIKLLQTGHALASIVALKAQNLHRSVFPVLDAVFDEGCAQGDVFQHALPHLIDGLFSGYVGDRGSLAQPAMAHDSSVVVDAALGYV